MIWPEEDMIIRYSMTYPTEANISSKLLEKLQKWQFSVEMPNRKLGFTDKIVPVATGCLGGGMKNWKDDKQQRMPN